MTEADALTLLYPGTRARDLTMEGYQEAITALRLASPGEARRVERALQPVLHRVFPRRAVPWHATSQGLRARLRFLPENPHLESDARAVRAAFGIDATWFALQPADEHVVARFEQLLKPGRTRPLLEAHRAGEWLAVHRGWRDAADDGFPDDLPLTPAAVQCALRTRDLGVAASLVLPGWVEIDQEGAASLDQVARALLQRHRLPTVRSLSETLLWYVLTADPAHVVESSFVGTLLASGVESVTPGYDSFPVTIAGIDEFVTDDDWMALREGAIRWRQEMYLRQRGSAPNGKRSVDIGALARAMPVYRAVADGGSVEHALTELSRAGSEYATRHALDLKTVRGHMAQLRQLLQPVD